MHAWPMPEVQKQIDSIREAFSADTRRPFVLKPSFPYGSPHTANRLSPARSHPGNNNYTHRPSVRGSIDHPQQQTIDTPERPDFCSDPGIGSIHHVCMDDKALEAPDSSNSSTFMNNRGKFIKDLFVRHG